MTAKVFLLPDLGEGLTEGEIVSWSVAVGDVVEVDQIIAVIETAKAAVDLPCPYAGTVLTLHGAEGEVLDVGAPLITIETQAPASAGASDSGPAPTTASATETESAEDASGNVLIGYGTSGAPARRRRTSSAIASEPQAPEVSSKPGSRVRVISPLVRRLAAEHGVDLRTLTPSGPKGIILRADVEAAITATNTPTNTAANAAASTTPAGSTIPAVGDVTVPMTLGQRTMAERLAVSRRDIPDATTWVDVDATGLMAMRTDLAAAWPEAGIGVLPGPTWPPAL